MNNDTIKKTISKNIVKYRKAAGLNQKEFAALLGAAPSRVSSWETGANSTDIDTLFRICKVLNVSINDMCEIYPESSTLLSYLEQDHIKKYRALNDHGKEVVNLVLESEYRNSLKTAAVYESNIHILNAAHERTDIEVTEEMKQHDEDIMDDDSIWS